jgi:hypothetical protein
VVASGGSVARAIQAVPAETSLGIAGIGSIANWDFPDVSELRRFYADPRRHSWRLPR